MERHTELDDQKCQVNVQASNAGDNNIAKKRTAGLTKHAHQQYCKRVESVAYDDLLELLNTIINLPHQTRKYDGETFEQLDGVWWATRDGALVTCYGRTSTDLPQAIAWAKRHRDNIVLEDMLWIEA